MESFEHLARLLQRQTATASSKPDRGRILNAAWHHFEIVQRESSCGNGFSARSHLKEPDDSKIRTWPNLCKSC